MPFQGVYITVSMTPRALPWTICLLAFQAICLAVSYYLQNLKTITFANKNLPVKIIHTVNLHLGQIIYQSYDRSKVEIRNAQPL